MKTKKNILIVEDHHSIRMLLGMMLSKQYSVTTKKDGLEGMSWLGSGNIPDLIVLDMSMPRLSGTEFLSGIRSSGFFRDIPVVVLSANDDPTEMDECHQLGIDDYVTKPFNPVTLSERINQILASREALNQSIGYAS